MEQIFSKKLRVFILSSCAFWTGMLTNMLAQNQKSLDADLDSLLSLRGFSQEYLYSPGQDIRAKEIAGFMESAGRFFLTELSFQPKTKLFIMAPRHWHKYAAPPLRNVYGFPHNIDDVHLAVATEDNDFWRSFLPPVDQLPQHLQLEIKKAYGTAQGSYSMRPFFDLLALHEMAHAYTGQAGLKMQRHWMNELFANIMLHTYVAENQPELLAALEVFPTMVVTAGTAEYQFTSLADFEKLYPTLGMGPKNYGWYQCRFHLAAKKFYDTSGKLLMKKLWNVLLKYRETLTDTELIDILRTEVDPVMADFYLNWNSGQ